MTDRRLHMTAQSSSKSDCCCSYCYNRYCCCSHSCSRSYTCCHMTKHLKNSLDLKIINLSKNTAKRGRAAAEYPAPAQVQVQVQGPAQGQDLVPALPDQQ